MAQPSTKVDVLQVEPAATGTRTISRDSTTGGLKFIDPANPTGVLLSDLVNLGQISSVSIVGVGAGSQYTTIQAAIDAAPTTASIAAPHVLLIASGVYTEDITIDKDGLALAALGYVRIVNATAGPTIHITEGDDGVPRFLQLRDVAIECTEDGESCVYVDGSNTFATGTVTVNTAPLAVGDTVVVGGVTLTGVAAIRTSGGNNFDTRGLTVTAVAAEIAAALNDADNSFTAVCTATASVGVVTITNATPGAGGNATTLSSVTSPGGGTTVSGATLTGGGGIDSEVGLDEVALINCTLLATGIGTRQILTQTVNSVRVSGGTFFGSASTSECVIAQTASFKAIGVEWINDVQAAYDTGEDPPSVVTSEFVVSGCGRAGDFVTEYIGAGSVQIANTPVVGDLTINGDQSFTGVNCEFGACLIEDTVVARMVNCTRDSLAGTGTPTVAESSLVLSSVLVAALSDVVTFSRLQPNAVYAVLVDAPTLGVNANVTAKSAGGFTVTFSAAVTGTAFYTVMRQM